MRSSADVYAARRSRVAVLAATSLCFLMPAQPVSAAPVDAANASCRAAIAKSVSKLANTTMKAFDGCIKAGLKGETVDCSDHETADLKSKIDRAKVKLADTITAKCSDTTHAVALSEMQTCGPPDGAALAQFDDLPGCYNDMVPENLDSLRNFILNPYFSTATGDIAKCIQTIAKYSTKLMKTIQKEKHKTIKAEDALGFDSNYLDPGDASGKIGEAVFKGLVGISDACVNLSDIEWKAVSSCDNGDIDAPICILQNVIQAADGLVAAAYDLPGICPAIVDILFLDGAEDGVVKRSTDLDLGSTGAGHQSDSNAYFVQSIDLDCGSLTGNDCSTCSASVSCDGGNCRCRNDNFLFCDEPFVADADDCGGNVCDVLLGPPLPAPAASTPVCLVQRIESLGGTTSFTNGATELVAGLRTFLHIGISQTAPCPTCVDEVCEGGERDGLFCVSDALSDFGEVSYDCPPTTGTNLTGTGIATDVALSTGSDAFTALLPCDSPLEASDCHCSACSGDPTIACRTDTVCVNAGAGLCSTTQAGHLGQAREPNDCSDLTCTPVAGEPGEGECLADEETWCNGIVKGNGDGIVSCTDNADCDANPGAGTCTQTRNRRCFLDPIAVVGSGGPRTGVDNGVLASAYCVPPSSHGGVNTAYGFPGPARMTQAAEFYAVCADEFTLWSPGGAVCQ